MTSEGEYVWDWRMWRGMEFDRVQ